MFRKITKNARTRKAVWFAAVAGLLLSSAPAEAAKFEAGRRAVENYCSSNGGSAFGTRSNGAYGCVGDDMWIYCESNGQCEGGITGREVTNAKPRPSRKLPPPRSHRAGRAMPAARSN